MARYLERCKGKHAEGTSRSEYSLLLKFKYMLLDMVCFFAVRFVVVDCIFRRIKVSDKHTTLQLVVDQDTYMNSAF